jgi:hypothetical protein
MVEKKILKQRIILSGETRSIMVALHHHSGSFHAVALNNISSA